LSEKERDKYNLLFTCVENYLLMVGSLGISCLPRWFYGVEHRQV
jgi:hypothetical protein